MPATVPEIRDQLTHAVERAHLTYSAHVETRGPNDPLAMRAGQDWWDLERALEALENITRRKATA